MRGGTGKPGFPSRPMEKKKAVSQVKGAPLGVHFLIRVEKLGKDEVSALPNSSANVSANSGRDTFRWCGDRREALGACCSQHPAARTG